MFRAANLLIFAAVGLCLPVLALASPAPTTPTYLLGWGSLGSTPAQFNFPAGIATDVLGNVYVADRTNNRIQKFDRLGNFMMQWGSAGSGNGQFNDPFAVTVDGSGNVYVAEYGGHRVQKFTSGGVYVLQWGSLGSGVLQFNHPTGIVCDAAGSVYVVDQFNYRVQKFGPTGLYQGQFGSFGTGNGQLNLPMGIGIDPAGNLYVADFGNSRVEKFSSAGVFLQQLGSGPGNAIDEMDHPYGVSVDAAGNIYVADTNNHRIHKYSAAGNWLTMWGSLGAANGQFNYPHDLAVDAAGNIYVADTYNHRIQKFSAAGAVAPSDGTPGFALTWGSYGFGSGQMTTPMGLATDGSNNVVMIDYNSCQLSKWTSTGTLIYQFGVNGAGNGQFSAPHGVAVDAFGSAYVADYGNNRIQKFNSAGAYVTQWGTAGTGNGQFSGLQGVAVDAAGNVYTSEIINQRVQKFTSAGAYLGQWGTAGTGNGQFNRPRGIAFDPAGNVYVVDCYNHRIQKFTSTGVYLTQWGSVGSGDGRFLYPIGIAIDPASNVYVADANNARIQKFSGAGTYLAQFTLGTGIYGLDGVAVDHAGSVYCTDQGNSRILKFAAPPAVALVSDVGNDQGRQVRLRILGCSADAPGAGISVTGYAVYRRVDALPAPGIGTRSASTRTGLQSLATPDAVTLAGWDYLGSQPAAGDGEYSMVVPTLTDANASSLNYSAFMVRALTSDPLIHYDSGVEYGISVDNLSPPAPSPFAAAFAAGITHLHWGVNTASDFATFRLYRGLSASFTPGPGNLIAAVTDTGYADVAPSGGFYKLSAVDFNGNESAFALVGPGQTLDAPTAPVVTFALEGAHPNPAMSGRMSVYFSLPSSEAAKLELIDLAGRRVAERAVGALGAGRHVVDLSEGRSLPAGLYLVRLTQGANTRVTRVASLR